MIKLELCIWQLYKQILVNFGNKISNVDLLYDTGQIKMDLRYPCIFTS